MKSLTILTILGGMVSAASITVAPSSARGICSSTPVTACNYASRLESKTVPVVYLLTKANYDKLTTMSSTNPLTSIQFDNVGQSVCNTLLPGPCVLSGGVSNLPADIYCVA